MTKNILIIGGAGFIGSHVNKLLGLKGYETTVLDDLSTGAREAVVCGEFVRGNFGDKKLLETLFSKNKFDAVMHFAALTDVGESVRDPKLYYENNVANTLTLLNTMLQHSIKTIIFSSSAAVYGILSKDFAKETDPAAPINPYGRTKLMVEKILGDYDSAYGLRSCSLRYFNAAGGDPDGEIKNNKKKENNLIPLVLRSLLSKTQVTIFGADYPTPDGTGVRDYIHVMDLAGAHILAMEKLLRTPGSSCYNLGNGRGYSVREVIKTAESITGLVVEAVEGPRRPGDPAMLMADAEKAKKELGWKQKYSDLNSMIKHAWQSLLPGN